MKLTKLMTHPHFTPWLIFVFFIIVYFSSAVGVMNSGDAPQYALTQVLVEDKTTKIDDYMEYVYPDYAEFAGHKYTDRAPGLSIASTPIYYFAKKLEPFGKLPYKGEHPALTESSRLEVLFYSFTSFWAALVPLLLYLISRQLGYSRFSSLVGSLSVGLGSLLWKYSASFVRQPLASALVLAGLYLLIHLEKSFKSSRGLVFGLVIGFLVLTEYLSFIQAMILGAYLLFLVLRGLRAQKINLNKAAELLVWVFIGGLSVVAILAVYNSVSFGRVLTTSRLYYAFPYANKLDNTFIADLRWSIPLSLFSYGPIPKEAFSFLNFYPEIAEGFPHYKWASVWPYLGIFVQSPLLVVGAAGVFMLKNRYRNLVLLLFILFFVLMAKFFHFYNPTAYDTRYFIPATVLLFLGVPPLISWGRTKQGRFKVMFLILTFGLLLASMVLAVVGVSRHYAPHVSGEHRFEIKEPLISFANTRLVIKHSLPNIYNLHLLLISLTVLLLCFYGIKHYMNKGTCSHKSAS